jgi:hypothetical protein
MDYINNPKKENKQLDFAPVVYLVWDLTSAIWDKFETLFDLHPLAKLEMFTDRTNTECKVRFFKKAS